MEQTLDPSLKNNMFVSIPFDHLIQADPEALAPMMERVIQGQAVIDCTDIEDAPSDDLERILTQLPDDWDEEQISLIFREDTLGDRLAEYILTWLDRIVEAKIIKSPNLAEVQINPIIQKILPAIEDNYVFLDLEVSENEEIYLIGVVSSILNETYKNIDTAQEDLYSLQTLDLHICGHNFRRFDYRYLINKFPTLEPWLVIDTLELSILAFPLENSHRLNKDYKLSDYSSNNPFEDAQATKKLLQKILKVFENKPTIILDIYQYLLCCGDDLASQAYSALFEINKRRQPSIEDIPTEFLENIDEKYFKNFLDKATEYNFDERLCFAGIFAWNYESIFSDLKPPVCAWLTRLKPYYLIFNQLRPIIADISYHNYLEEFGLKNFRGKQEQAIQAILFHENPLILMATGGGKSLCYQLPALTLSYKQRGLTIVISPLQALMEDQVQSLQEKELNFSTFINGNILISERRERLNKILDGEYDLLYISPEQLRSISIRSLLQERLPSLIIFDEAHCISQWGHDFRPDYRYAPKFINELYAEQNRELPLMAFMTATATKAVRHDIKELFKEHDIVIQNEICSSSTRENLNYQIIPINKQEKESQILEYIKNNLRDGGAIIVYAPTRKKTEEIFKILDKNKIESRYYHAKISKNDKQDILEKFKSKELNIIVATCAFGMGIDRPDVKTVIHYSMTGSLESYVQESGRAGRDGEASDCVLFFNPADAEFAFFLQSLNQLSKSELINIFVTAREIYQKSISQDKKVKEEFFWVTPNEIFLSSNLTREFASTDEQTDTKIKVALSYLEAFGMIERAENQSLFIEFDLCFPLSNQSIEQFKKYAAHKKIPLHHQDKFIQLILTMHLAKSHCQATDNSYSLEKISDGAGIEIKDLRRNIKELEKAEVCTFKIPITLIITKIDSGNRKNDAITYFENHQKIEMKILEEIENKFSQNNAKQITINCRGLATHIDPDFKGKLSGNEVLRILEGWDLLKWVRLKKSKKNLLILNNFSAHEEYEKHIYLVRQLLKVLYQELENRTGIRISIKKDIGELLSQVNQISKPVFWEAEQLEKILFWMHKHKIIRLADGLSLFQQSMKLKIKKGVRKDTVNKEYPIKVKPLYEEQARRTHIMLAYGDLHRQQNADLQKFIGDYFSSQRSDFSDEYPNTDGEAVKRPVTPEDYDRIISPLNSIQREIVLSESSAISVIAGPGSGKTKTIVHRIAYLIKVKRVNPTHIIALAYNRNAVRELRIRLQELIGELASYLKVYTFHGLALAIIGRTVNNSTQKKIDVDQKFSKLIENAYNFIKEDLETGDEQQSKILESLGEVEYIFVDEYQDVAEHEYRLVEIIAGLQNDNEVSSTQTNICVIGDDDQNIYEFRDTSVIYIQSFQEKYQAQQFILRENYRSTEAIIESSNSLIKNNFKRIKLDENQQIIIDDYRLGNRGMEVQDLHFVSINKQAQYIGLQIKKWLKEYILHHEIAVLAKEWKSLNEIRAYLDNLGIKNHSIKGKDIKLIHNLSTCLLLDFLERKNNDLLSETDPVSGLFIDFFKDAGRSLSESTIKVLLAIAEDIDLERGFGSEELSTSISINEIITSIYEFNDNPDNHIEQNSVLLSTCHSSKGLEFKNVILLADGFSYNEAERRLFYVAMTRAKDKLILTRTSDSEFVKESRAIPYNYNSLNNPLPKFIYYDDMTPGHVHLGYSKTKNRQSIIKKISEGDFLVMKKSESNNIWEIRNIENITIGLLGKNKNQELIKQGIDPSNFVFKDKEVAVRSIYRHLKTDPITGVIIEDWFVVIPKIRICR